MSAFQWDDPFLFGQQLSDEERQIQQLARDYCQERLQPRVLEAFEKDHFDREILREMGGLGLLGATVAETYGGAGANHVAYGLIAREVERVDSGYRSAMSVQSSLVMYPIEAYGTEAQKQRYLPELASGEMVGCFGLTEPNAGSDPGSMQTRAKKVEGGYRLSGQKMWITNSPIADIAVVWAKSDAHEGKIKGFVVERGAEVYSNPQATYPAVIIAAWKQQQAVVDYFLTEIPDRADGTNRLGVTINLAARQGWTDLVRRHIEADPLAVHQRGWIGDSPLHWPAHNGDTDTMGVLLDAGADINGGT